MLRWVRYGKRESIVERFRAKGKWWVREIYPRREPREHAVPWRGAGYRTMKRKVYLTPDKPAPKKES